MKERPPSKKAKGRVTYTVSPNRKIYLTYGIERITNGQYYGCDMTGHLIIPPTVVEIGNFAFCMCSRLKSVTIPKSVQTIGIRAFAGCKSLKSITIADEVCYIWSNAFEDCTFSGTFNTRSDKMLVEHSGLICIDFDHLENVEELFAKLLEDEYFDTQLLFRSPSGDGLKWVIPIDLQKCDHQQYFKAIEVYIRETYGVQIDKSGKDISRACFLPYDPKAYINEKYLGA